nr:class I SAM-dependent methyltransferase [Shewanella sp. NIFS-20-20]
MCHGQSLVLFCQDKRRRYYCCNDCRLVSVPPEQYLSSQQEKAEYDKHDNASDDSGYRRFLGRTWLPLLERLQLIYPDLSSLRGLDFGCGEGAILSKIAQEAGVTFANYDLYYHPHPERLNQQYHVITLTEVIEHIADAAGLMIQLDNMLVAGGVLAIMTKRVSDSDAFGRWHYKNDLTHINFYSGASFQWIAQQYGWQLEIIAADVVFFTKAG